MGGARPHGSWQGQWHITTAALKIQAVKLLSPPCCAPFSIRAVSVILAAMKSLPITALLAAIVLSACATGRVLIPDDLSPAELIQRAQEASDKNRYNTALQYYQALQERNPTNIDLVCAAEYEIAFIHYKQKKYALAKDEFGALLERYDSPDAEYLPQKYKLLANKVLERIHERENPQLREKKK